MKLQEHQIKAAAEALDRVREIDRTICRLGEVASDRAAEWGERTRNIFGRNLLTQFRNDVLGEIVLCAVINALLKKRAEVMGDHGDVVEFPDAPCPRPSIPEMEY